MARILYGVAGEGYGHSSRAKEIIKHLIKKGHKVKVISHDKGYEVLSRYFDVERISGLGFVYKNNRVQYGQTVLKNIFNSPKLADSLKKVIDIASRFKPDVFFSDFEPITAMVANLRFAPLISIDNQHRLLGKKMEYPSGYRKELLAAQTVTRLMILRAHTYLITSFFPINPEDKKKSFIFPPILRQEVLKVKTKTGGHILVYLTSEFSNAIDILKRTREKYIVYGFNKDAQDGNIQYKKRSEEGFLNDLAASKAVIANAGFTLLTEALYLGKPMLAIPVEGQFEQVINAFYLDKLKYGLFAKKLTAKDINKFIANLSNFQDHLKKYSRADNSKIFRKIDELIKLYSKL